jgi:hypothetical protein
MAAIGKTAPRQSTRAISGLRGRAARAKAAGTLLPQSHDNVFVDCFDASVDRLKTARLIVNTSWAMRRDAARQWVVATRHYSRNADG